ncbi:hypothetical protein Tdes44962_MAKER00722 [Teratosphaeria destructans]|uniref:Uncharacterized protein n=1 Tax=Teratosphaeria destructans TaxID=418781 RepID=A0A9W7VZP0_9PEZI|nr:hypothetical protein Tdes44962_MAKER00722 [Teratosphaeria destructans]
MRTAIFALLSCCLGFALADPILTSCADVNYAGCSGEKSEPVACPSSQTPPADRGTCDLKLHFSQTEDIYCCTGQSG